ncbi:MAG: hypothetical protein P4L33_10545 [Capsulimonadaceae bacterium]|nr:hypothetical protein [Capsulimonadaceae bacterium]
MAAPLFENIPDELKIHPRWTPWAYKDTDPGEEPKKLPLNANGRGGAKINHPETLVDYPRAVEAFENSQSWTRGPGYDGLMFAIVEGDGFAGLDIDDCIDPDTGIIEQWALEIVEQLNSYTEISPSGTGVKIFMIASKPGARCCKKPHFEFYDRSRFFTVTGNRFPGSPSTVEKRQAECEAVYNLLFPPEPPRPVAVMPDKMVDLSDSALLARALGPWKNSAKFNQLWFGDYSMYSHAKDPKSKKGYREPYDHSAGDLGLCNLLAFWCGPQGHAQVDRLFRQSGMMRAKWDRHARAQDATYGAGTVRLAVDGCSTFWDPRYRSGISPRSRALTLGDRGDDAQHPAFEGEGARGEMPDGGRSDKPETLLPASGSPPPDQGGIERYPAAPDDPDREASLLDEAAWGPRNDLPRIETYNVHLRERAGETFRYMVAANDPPEVFRRGSCLARIEVDAAETISIKDLNVPTLRNRLTHVVAFISTSEKRGSIAVKAPVDIMEDIMAWGKWPEVPIVEGVTRTPIFDQSGTLLDTPGYHPSARIYYLPEPGLEIGDTTPSPESVAAARSLIEEEIFVNFPFADQASKAHAMALVLLPFLRPLISGPTPLHLIDAPQAGTGKSLLAQACISVFTGMLPGAVIPPTTEEEWQKTLTGVFKAGGSHFFLDNARMLNSISLFAALTTGYWEGRLLNMNEMGRYPIVCTFVATANNVAAGPELLRRSISIRLDSGVERPEERSGWKHDPLLSWIRENRSEFVTAAITLARAWVDGGRPKYTGAMRPLGSFEGWFHTMGGVLDVIGMQGFLENREAFRDRAENEDAPWYVFVEKWAELFSNRVVGAAELFELATEYLGPDADGATETAKKAKFGKRLASHTDRIYGAYRIVYKGKSTSGANKGAKLFALSPTDYNNPMPSLGNTDPTISGETTSKLATQGAFDEELGV